MILKYTAKIRLFRFFHNPQKWLFFREKCHHHGYFRNNIGLVWIIRTFALSLLIEDVDDRDYIAELVRATCKELPAPKPKVKHDKLF